MKIHVQVFLVWACFSLHLYLGVQLIMSHRVTCIKLLKAVFWNCSIIIFYSEMQIPVFAHPLHCLLAVCNASGYEEAGTE